MKIPLTPPPFLALLKEITPQKWAQASAQGPLVKGRYLHWDELRHRTPPAGLSHEAWWCGIKIARQGLLKSLPLCNQHGRPWKFGVPDPVMQALHRIDRNAAGRVEMALPVASHEQRDRYLVSSLIEEAITSSQLEGAVTTYQEAKAMLRSGRPPRDRSEQMILNNFQVMEYIREIRDEPLTPALILDIHRRVTAETLDDPSAAGRLRRPEEPVHVMDAQHSTVLHTPPPAHSLPQRLEQLCEFANQEDDAQPFVHPAIRAILLHFMLGYDHPFVDGNGRTARALFYWSVARQGYWLMEFVSISRFLKQAPAQYARAYLHTETDDNDTTYFLIHQLSVIERAIEALRQYLGIKIAQQHDAERLLRQSPALNSRLNHRQIALLSHALRHPSHGYTVDSHQRSHRITNQTARTDLLKLAELGLLEKIKRGRAFLFYVPSNLEQRIRECRPAG